MPTPEQVKAARVYANGLATQAQMTPREHAEGAWHPGCGKSVDQLEDEIRAARDMTPRNRNAS